MLTELVLWTSAVLSMGSTAVPTFWFIRRARHHHKWKDLKARADIQNTWYLTGDARGFYGAYPPACGPYAPEPPKPKPKCTKCGKPTAAAGTPGPIGTTCATCVRQELAEQQRKMHIEAEVARIKREYERRLEIERGKPKNTVGDCPECGQHYPYPVYPRCPECAVKHITFARSSNSATFTYNPPPIYSPPSLYDIRYAPCPRCRVTLAYSDSQPNPLCTCGAHLLDPPRPLPALPPARKAKRTISRLEEMRANQPGPYRGYYEAYSPVLFHKHLLDLMINGVVSPNEVRYQGIEQFGLRDPVRYIESPTYKNPPWGQPEI